MIKNILERVAKSLLAPINPSLILVLGFYTVLWGAWLVNPFWTVFTHAAVYSAMAHFAWFIHVPGEAFWGAIAMVTGALTLRGAFKPSYTNLHVGSFAAALHWLLIGILYFIGDWHNTGGITALCFFVYAAVVYVNVKVNKHLYEKSNINHRK